MFFGDWLQQRELLSPNNIALIDSVMDDQQIIYQQWNRRVNRLAHYRRSGLDIEKGDRVYLGCSLC